MVCPSCGKYVAGTEALCSFCGAALEIGVTPSSAALPPAGGGTMPSTSEEISRQRRDAIACLVLGLFSFAALPASFAIQYYEINLTAAVATTLYVTAFVTALAASVLALIFGSRANKALWRIQGRVFRRFVASCGMALGVLGVGLAALVIFTQIATTPTRRRFYFGPNAVGPLRTINTAAITYSCLYGHGFPLKLSNLAPPKSEKYDSSKINEQAAGLIPDILAAGAFSGYRFYYVAGPMDSEGKVLTYNVHAEPLKKWAGAPHYFTDQSGIIRKEAKRQAEADSPIIEGGASSSGRGDDCREILRLHNLNGSSRLDGK